ncbi:MAG: VUT family protein [Lachnospiraceae bacterium]|nr:VUT family protein [Lachnospiraceae bacterium]
MKKEPGYAWFFCCPDSDRRRFLWRRNNDYTLVSLIPNTFLFTLFAFYGTCDTGTLLPIFASSYAVYISTSLPDAPILYLPRKIHPNTAE